MNDTKKPKKLMNRRTWSGVAVLGVAAGTLGVAMALPNQGSSPKKTVSLSADTAVKGGAAKADKSANGIVLKAYSGGCVRLQGEGCQAFVFPTTTSGDCRRHSGARWELTPDGRAYFRGRFQSGSGDDAWLMRARLLDSAGGQLGYLRSSSNPGGDSGKFVFGLPDTRLYTYGVNAYFGKHMWNDIQYISLTKHC
ncbi:DUF6294 family protein [Streptomyces sp. N35]|uniref:DUF6294 family protein n=1 Tax=Streptomyces sp. N35 TaxID=2795730 RepID=UPI0018F4DB13|nr:DUF6294 family protein [Streptomyces sp. N35]